MSLSKGIGWGLQVGITLVVVMVAGPPLGDFLSGLHDAAWWDVLPWGLLVAFWAVVGPRAWCQLRDERAG